MAWAIKIWSYSMIHFWQSKHGGFCIIKTLYFIEFLKAVSSLIVLLWRPKILDPVHTRGEVSYKGGISFKGAQGGGLGMDNL